MKARDLISKAKYWAKWHPLTAYSLAGLIVGFILGKVL